MNKKRSVFKNISSNWLGLAFNIAISFFLAPFIVRSLGNAYYGVWVILMQFTGYLYLMDFGVRESIIRQVSQYGAGKNLNKLTEVLSASLQFYTVIGGIVLLLSILFALLFPYLIETGLGDRSTIRFVVVTTGLTVAQALAFNVYVGIIMGEQRYDLFNLIGIGLALARTILVIILLQAGYGIVALAIIQLAIGLANSLLVRYFARRLLLERGLRFSYTHRTLAERAPIIREIYNYSTKVLVNNLGQKAIYYTDALVIGILLNTSFVTFYAIAGNLIEYARRLLLTSNSVLNPLVSSLDAVGESKKIESVITHGTRFSMYVCAPIAIVYITMGRQFIEHWMGEEYGSLSGDVLIVLAVGTLLSTPQNTISNVLYGTSRHGLIARLRVYEAISNLFLSVALINVLGIVGVALGTAIPQVLIMGILLPISTLKMMEIPIVPFVRKAIITPLIIAVPFAVLCQQVNMRFPAQNLFVLMGQIVVLMLLYVLSVGFMGLSQIERKALHDRFRNARQK